MLSLHISHHEIDYEGEEPLPRHAKSFLFVPRTFDTFSHGTAYLPPEGRHTPFPTGRTVEYYSSQIKTCTHAIQQAQKNGDRNLAAYLQLFFARSFAHERTRNLEAALQDLEKCVQLDRKFAPAYFNRAVLQYHSSNYNKASEDINAAIKIDATKPLYYEFRSRLLHRMKDCIGAATDIETARKLKAAIHPTQPDDSLATTADLRILADATRKGNTRDTHAERLFLRLLEKSPGMRTETDIKRIAHQLPRLNALRTLETDYAALLELAESVCMRVFKRDDYVFKEGDVGTAYFVLYEGAVVITAGATEDKAATRLKRLNKGDGFGEGALFTEGRTRTANALVEQDSVILTMPLIVYNTIVNNNTDRLQLLSHCPSFRTWSDAQKLELASKMRSKLYEGNATILRLGDTVKELYIIKTGVARVLKPVPWKLLKEQPQERRTSTADPPARSTRIKGRLAARHVKQSFHSDTKEVPGSWTLEEDWRDRDAGMLEAGGQPTCELTVAVLCGTQVIGELCVLDPGVLSPVSVVAYTSVELYAIKGEDLEAMGAKYDAPLTLQLQKSFDLHNPSIEKIAYLFREEVRWAMHKERQLATIMPKYWLAERAKANASMNKSSTTSRKGQRRPPTRKVPQASTIERISLPG